MDKKTPQQVAEEKLSEIKKQKEEKPDLKPEAKPEVKPAVEDKKPDEKANILKMAEEQAKRDEELLSKKDEEMSDEEKKRKTELLAKKEKKESPDEKAKKIHESTQKRIDELVGELKSLKDERSKDVERIDRLEKEKADLEKRLSAPKEREDEVSLLKKAETERLRKYLDEDKTKPLAERREMSKEDLEAWLLEDYVSANEWLSERSIRRSQERGDDSRKLNEAKKFKALSVKQDESAKRSEARHPELNVDKRMAELKAQGKSENEIHTTLCKENPKYRIAMEIIAEDAAKYFGAENGPELIAEEMEKRLKAESEKKEQKPRESEEEKEARIRREAAEDERQRLARIDESIDPSKKSSSSSKEKTDFEKKQEEIARRAGMSPERLKAVNERRSKIPGLAVKD